MNCLFAAALRVLLVASMVASSVGEKRMGGRGWELSVVVVLVWLWVETADVKEVVEEREEERERVWKSAKGGDGRGGSGGGFMRVGRVVVPVDLKV